MLEIFNVKFVAEFVLNKGTILLIYLIFMYLNIFKKIIIIILFHEFSCTYSTLALWQQFVMEINSLKFVIETLTLLNFLNELVHLSILEPSIINFVDLQLSIYQYRAWSDCTDVQVSLALYCWEKKLITLLQKFNRA